MEQKALDFLRKLSESFGPSGFERDAVKIVKEYVAPFADELKSDRLGSLHFSAKGKGPVVLLPGHVDEVGFVVSGVNAQGFLTFNPLGGWFDQVLLGQRVRVRTNKGVLAGIIAAKPPHLMSADERAKVVTKEKMFIDIGASNEKEAKEMGVRIGDPAVPDSPFATFEKAVYRKPEGGGEEKRLGTTVLATGKGFDDRIGAWIAAEVLRRLKEQRIDHPNTVTGAATVQEEVGLRGARTTANVAQPDVCITLEVDIAGDVPGIESHEAAAKMGLGPSLVTYDASMIPNQGLKEFIIRTAEECRIPLQLSQMRGGGTDGGAIHVANAGCPCVVLGVPTRHIHSHVGMLSLEDLDNAVSLVTEVVKRLDAKTVESFTAV